MFKRGAACLALPALLAPVAVRGLRDLLRLVDGGLFNVAAIHHVGPRHKRAARGAWGRWFGRGRSGDGGIRPWDPEVRGKKDKRRVRDWCRQPSSSRCKPAMQLLAIGLALVSSAYPGAAPLDSKVGCLVRSDVLGGWGQRVGRGVRRRSGTVRANSGATGEAEGGVNGEKREDAAGADLDGILVLRAQNRVGPRR